MFNSYWLFAALRQQVYFRRVLGKPPPWTDDPVLGEHRFTNAYRAADRVSQYLIREVIITGPQRIEDIVLRVLLFKLFNRIRTWRTLEREVGQITARSFNVERFDHVLSREMTGGRRVYSAAYIMPVSARFRGGRKHTSHLRLLAQMMADGLPRQLASAKKMSHAYRMLLAYSGIGPFLAFQYVIDLNYSECFAFNEMDFVVPGPGCRSGLRKCFSDPGEYGEEDLIRFMCDRQEIEFGRRGLAFRTLFGRRLHLVDCQNLFCETDKYARVVHPDAAGIANRTRIKQKYTPNRELPEPWFPPKWSINDRVQAVLRDERGIQ